MTEQIARFVRSKFFAVSFRTILFAVLLLAAPLYDSLSSAPHFRLFTNAFGGGKARAGFYFPHDEFYDASTREIVAEIASRARENATVAVETPNLFEFYARRAGREDLKFVSLSDKESVENLAVGDFVVAARGRRYASNDEYLNCLENSAAPAAEIKIGEVISARVYQLDETASEQIHELAKR